MSHAQFQRAVGRVSTARSLRVMIKMPLRQGLERIRAESRDAVPVREPGICAV